jgi:hypothetical protein
MRARRAHGVLADRPAGTVRWRRAVVMTVAAAAPLAAVAATAVPAYAVTAAIPVGSDPTGVAADPAPPGPST